MKVKRKLKLRVSARDNRRYFVTDAKSNEDIEIAIREYIGILGLAKSAYMPVKKENGNLIGSCLRESLNDVLASLAFAKIRVLKVSGTIKGLE